MDKSVKIIIATHKRYEMPKDKMYIPLHVGAEGKNDLGYTKDNTGNNISSLNPYFCELTGLYWSWKNLDADYIGLVHYRRHFSNKKGKGFKAVLAYNDIKSYLGNVKIFVPKKRKYYIETLYSHYSHTHYEEHLTITKLIIEKKYPDYKQSFSNVMNQTYGYMFNMMIMEKELFNQYCTWLFDILFELDKKVDRSKLDSFHARYLGRISELLFNVWINYQLQKRNISKEDIKELPWIYMEKINYFNKGISFIKAKLLHKRYSGSF